MDPLVKPNAAKVAHQQRALASPIWYMPPAANPLSVFWERRGHHMERRSAA